MSEQKFKDGDVVKHKITEFKMVVVSAREVVHMFKCELPTHAKAMGWASGFNGCAT